VNITTVKELLLKVIYNILKINGFAHSMLIELLKKVELIEN
jgi:hypothetical protein